MLITLIQRREVIKTVEVNSAEIDSILSGFCRINSFNCYIDYQFNDNYQLNQFKN